MIHISCVICFNTEYGIVAVGDQGLEIAVLFGVVTGFVSNCVFTFRILICIILLLISIGIRIRRKSLHLFSNETFQTEYYT